MLAKYDDADEGQGKKMGTKATRPKKKKKKKVNGNSAVAALLPKPEAVLDDSLASCSL